MYLSLLYVFINLVITSEAQNSKGVTALYVFGDSLLDVGNNNHLISSPYKANYPHNGLDFPTGPTGRFCNGKNTADFLAEKLGLPTPLPYLSLSTSDSQAIIAGVNFASGAAQILNGTYVILKQAISLTNQVYYYSIVYKTLVEKLGSAAAHQHLSKSLFPIEIGSNDLFHYFQSQSDLTPQQYIDSMLSAMNGVLKRLHDLGARKFILNGVPALGCTPGERIENKDEACNNQLNFWAAKYNNGLKFVLQRFKLEFSDIHYSYFDTYSALLDFIHNPTTYGFTEVKGACCGLGKLRAEIPCLPISTYCFNRSDHIFWDLFGHPTQKTAALFIHMSFNGSQYVTPITIKQLAAL